MSLAVADMRALLLALLVLAGPSTAAMSTATAQVMQQAFDSETEQAACARVRTLAEQQAVSELLDQARSLKRFHQTLDDYRFAGFDRQRMNDDLSQAIVIHGQWTEVQRVWSGRSCLVQLLAEVDLDSAMARLAEALPERGPDPAPAAPSAEAPWWQQVPGIGQFTRANHLARALSELTTIKVMVAEFWASEGRWPRSLSELGLDAGSFNRSTIIERVRLEQDGVINAVLKNGLGGEWVALTPTDGPMGMLNWRCTTSVDVRLGACEGP